MDPPPPLFPPPTPAGGRTGQHITARHRRPAPRDGARLRVRPVAGSIGSRCAFSACCSDSEALFSRGERSSTTLRGPRFVPVDSDPPPLVTTTTTNIPKFRASELFGPALNPRQHALLLDLQRLDPRRRFPLRIPRQGVQLSLLRRISPFNRCHTCGRPGNASRSSRRGFDLFVPIA